MGRLDIRDPRRDEDDSADSSVTSEALGTDVRPLAETCCEYEVFDKLTGRCLRAGFTEWIEACRFASLRLNTEIRKNWRG